MIQTISFQGKMLHKNINIKRRRMYCAYILVMWHGYYLPTPLVIHVRFAYSSYIVGKVN